MKAIINNFIKKLENNSTISFIKDKIDYIDNFAMCPILDGNVSILLLTKDKRVESIEMVYCEDCEPLVIERVVGTVKKSFPSIKIETLYTDIVINKMF